MPNFPCAIYCWVSIHWMMHWRLQCRCLENYTKFATFVQYRILDGIPSYDIYHRYTSSLSELGFFPSQLNRLWKGPEKLMADTIAYLKFGFRFIGDGANPERVCGAAVADFHSSRISNPTELHLKIWMFKDVIGNSSLQMKEQEKDSTFKLFLMD